MVGGFIAVGATTDRIFELSMCEVGSPEKNLIYEDVKIYGREQLFSVSLSKTKNSLLNVLKKFQKSKLNNRRTHFPLFLHWRSDFWRILIHALKKSVLQPTKTFISVSHLQLKETAEMDFHPIVKSRFILSTISPPTTPFK